MKQLRPYQQDAVAEAWNALKLNDDPVLLMASVGAGKSLMLADMLLTFQRAGKKALCLVNNAELVRNNCETFVSQGGKAGIYCSALGERNTKHPIIFGTPGSILNAINKKHYIGDLKFNIIVVDEAHAINYRNPGTCFMRILRHYKQEYKDMRVLGATGTNFRFKGNAIVGDKCLFKTQVGNITTEKLIADGYLIAPAFQVDPNLVLDFSRVKIKRNGLFDQKELEHVIEESARLTELICKQVIHIMESQGRRGVFFFATTRKHAYEIFSHLPKEHSAIILGDLPQNERTIILNRARTGEIKYLVNIAIISVGVDIPAYDTIAYLRPTESLVLLTQTMGRVLRLSSETKKTEALVLDFAGNIERHQDWDNPLLLEAVAKTINKDKPLVIQCPECQNFNTEFARRCIGMINEKRCEYFFEFRNCPNPSCQVKNDVTSRHCRICETEIIDPNAKLKLNLKNMEKLEEEVNVIKMNFKISGSSKDFRVICVYQCEKKHFDITEIYSPCTAWGSQAFYDKFVKIQCSNASTWFMHLNNREKVAHMLQTAAIPIRLLITPSKNGTRIKKKFFE